MVTHLVLFQPRPGLSAEMRASLADTLLQALNGIPSIRRLRVGRRITHGRPGYEQLMRTDYAYVALLEFDDTAGLLAYLEHPLHDALAARFFVVLQDGLMYDFELFDGEAGVQALAAPAGPA